MKKVINKKDKGITLIALVVTIVALIILAGISISVLSGDNGIISQAKKGKEETEISEEKEIIDVSVAQAVNSDVMGNLEKNKLQDKLNSNAGDGVTNVIDSGDTLVIKFIEKNRYYEVDKDGNTEGPKELIKDSNAGDLSKGGTVDGSEEKPFEINCIEDLVTFSIMVNGGNTELGITSTNFSGKHVILMRTLDFKSIFSYNDYTTTRYGDLNTDGIVEDIKTELTKTSDGCVGFTPIGNYTNDQSFNGNFDGRNNEIQNIYINTNGDAGLFGYVSSGVIKNIGVTGNIISKGGNAAGIVAKGLANFYNCYNKAKIKGKDTSGGIFGHVGWQAAKMEKCYNMGDIYSEISFAGGLAGRYAGEIINCYNAGKVVAQNHYAAGIVAQSAYPIIITNCYNSGEIYANVYSGGGIVAHLYGNTTANNCYNIGKITTKGTVSSSNCKGIGATTANNCYSIGQLVTNGTKPRYVIGATTLNSCYYYSNLTPSEITIESGLINMEGKTCNEFVELLNSYKDENGVYPEGWKKWKVGENGYPTFQ